MSKRFAILTLATFFSITLSASAIAGITVDQKCRSAKMKATGKKFAAEAKCYAKALSEGSDVSSECLALAQTKFDEAFVKAGSACQGTGGAVTDKLDDALEDIAGDVGCGDGRVVGDEECDDGNAVGGDGCSSTCFAGICGNGVLDEAVGEICDDDNTSSGDGCSADCGTTETGWECREGQLCQPIAGDGLVVGTEECDDRNTDSDDGCSADMVIELGWTCSVVGQPCFPIPGDGIVVGTEECDDSNTGDGDGCDSLMKTETGWTCTSSSIGSSTCNPICGDGRIIGTEECDDSSDSCADGCDNRCKIELGWNCVGEPSVCTP